MTCPHGRNQHYGTQLDLTSYENIPILTGKVTPVAVDGVTEVASPSTKGPMSVGGLIPVRGITRYLVQSAN
jgi:hypothetical protein